MSEQIKDGGPAFPCEQHETQGGNWNKTDRELLELAAKAAGNDAYWNTSAKIFMVPNGEEVWHKPWNPLDDDGDALRLAVKVRINIYNPPGRNASASVAHGEDENAVCSYLNEKSDDAAATRRAIVRAAAVMGETL